MNPMTTTLEKTAIATLAVVLTVITLAFATVAPVNADQPVLSTKLKPTVETVLVSYEPAVRVTRVN
jgi:hypothetical protein